MSAIAIRAFEESFPVAGSFTISRGSRSEARVVTVEVECDGFTGRGECVPYARYGENVAGVIETILSLTPDFAAGLDRAGLQARLPAGAARNGLDCALWDLEAKRSGRRAFAPGGLSAPLSADPLPVITAYTLSLGSPTDMAARAARDASRPLLKVKLGANGDLARIEAVRAAAPHSTIIVDANEGWTEEQYEELAPLLVRLGVALVEQPFPAGQDAALAGLERILPVCADESCHDRSNLAALSGKYDFINIKLDKTGGLTEALALEQEARAAGFGIMVGCMLGTSLSMAPALLLAQDADFVDLDGPLLLAGDRATPLSYRGSLIDPPSQDLWG